MPAVCKTTCPLTAQNFVLLDRCQIHVGQFGADLSGHFGIHPGRMGALVDRLQLAGGDVGKNRDGLGFGVSDPAYAGLDEADIGADLQPKRGTDKAEKATGSAFGTSALCTYPHPG